MRNERVHARQFQNTYQLMYPEKKVKTVTFIVTHQCNLRCTYCYETHKSDKRMTLETAKHCVDLLFAEDARNSEPVNDTEAHGLIIEFIGGEPFLEIGLIDRVMSYFLDQAIELRHRWATRYMINISTNGTLGDDPRVQAFVRKYAGRLSIGVTIDGDKAAHNACRVDCNGCGSYDKAIKMFREISGPNGKRTTKYTIAPGNLHLFADSVRHLVLDEDVDTLNCNCVYEEGWTIDHARELYRQLKAVSDMVRKSGTDTYISILDWEAGDPLPDTDVQNWCGGNGRMLAFDVDGTVLPCMRYSSISIGNQPLYRIGDMESGIAVREDDARRLAALQKITRQSQSEQKCLDCPIAQGCAWCTAYNYERTGTPDKRVTYICEMHRARVLAQCYHHNMAHLADPRHNPKRINVPEEWAIPIVGEEEYEMLLGLERKCFEAASVSIKDPCRTKDGTVHSPGALPDVWKEVNRDE